MNVEQTAAELLLHCRTSTQ